MNYTRSFYWLTYRFHRLPLRPHLKPAIGGPGTPLVELANRLSNTVYHALPVADSDNRLVGIISLKVVAKPGFWLRSRAFETVS